MNKILLIYFQGDKDGKVRIILFVHTVGVWHLSSIWMISLAGQRDIIGSENIVPFFEAFNEPGFGDFLLDYYCNFKAVQHNSASFRIEVASILFFIALSLDSSNT